MNKKYIMVIAAGSGMICSCLAMGMNLPGLFFSPIAAELGTGRGNVAMTGTIFNILLAVFGLMVPAILNRLGLRKTVLMGTILLVAVTCTLPLCRSLLPMYLLHAVRGFASAMMGTVPVTMMLNFWFRKKTALITSITMCFSGLLSAALSPVITGIIASFGWRMGYYFCALVIFLLNCPAIFLPIALRPEEVGFEPYGMEAAAVQKAETDRSLPIMVLPVILMLIFNFAVSYITAYAQHLPAIAESRNLAFAGAMMLSVCMVVNTSAKLVFGIVANGLGAPRASYLYIAGNFIGAILLLKAGGLGGMTAGAALLGLSYSLPTIAAASLTREVFGVDNYGRVYPKISLCGTVAMAAGTSLTGYIYDFTGNYTAALILLAAMAVVAFLSSYLALRYRKKQSV
ncbi:MAG: MFS transporter [Eubacterium sp.]|nr:MFS transporter [Eubacterium sp.]